MSRSLGKKNLNPVQRKPNQKTICHAKLHGVVFELPHALGLPNLHSVSGFDRFMQNWRAWAYLMGGPQEPGAV